MYRYWKRILDVLISAVSCVVLLPFFLVLALIIRLSSPGPVLFTQKRVGKGKRYFQIYKFRTMRIDTPHELPTHLLPDPERWITPVGRFLRRTSLDELPQLWNILKGDMSFVGPRPALWNQFDLIAARDRYIGCYEMTANDVRPGLTGWAQINGRDELPIAVKARFDGEYVQRFGFSMDWRCFFGTFDSVARQSGVVEGNGGQGPAQAAGHPPTKADGQRPAQSVAARTLTKQELPRAGGNGGSR